MKVGELILELSKIEDKELEVVVVRKSYNFDTGEVDRDTMDFDRLSHRIGCNVERIEIVSR